MLAVTLLTGLVGFLEQFDGLLFGMALLPRFEVGQEAAELAGCLIDLVRVVPGQGALQAVGGGAGVSYRYRVDG